MTEPQASTHDDVTAAVRNAWASVLKHDEFDLDSDFFAVGGNSLLVARVMAGLSKQFGVRLPLRMFMTDPTVRGLGRSIYAHTAT